MLSNDCPGRKCEEKMTSISVVLFKFQQSIDNLAASTTRHFGRRLSHSAKVSLSTCVPIFFCRWFLPNLKYQIRCSIVVSISACHAEDPGSIPGGGVLSGRGLLCLRFLAKASLCLGCAPLITSIRSSCCPALDALQSRCRRRGSISSAEWRSG